MNEIEFTKMVNSIRETEIAIGKVNYELTEKQISSKNFARSLYVVNDIKLGELITENNIRSIRPGHSLHPKYLPQILGKKAKKQFYIGDRIKLSDFELL